MSPNKLKYTFNQHKIRFFKQAAPQNICHFIYQYFLLRRSTLKTMLDSKYISPYNKDLGFFGDAQSKKETYCQYGDPAGDILLKLMQPLIEKEVSHSLIPTYSYARVYEKGGVLKRHTDRSACAISGTLFLGGEQWPIYIDPTGKIKQKGVRVDMEPGDMLIYSGGDLEHWRNEFKGEHCVQIFLHYNYTGYSQSELNKFDTRPTLGLPSYFKTSHHD